MQHRLTFNLSIFTILHFICLTEVCLATRTIIEKSNRITKDNIFNQVEQPCDNYLEPHEICLQHWRIGELWKEVQAVKKEILECEEIGLWINVSKRIIRLRQLKYFLRVCQNKLWLTLSILVLIVVIPFCTLACICYYCHKRIFSCCPCSVSRWSFGMRRNHFIQLAIFHSMNIHMWELYVNRRCIT